ncbi:ion channel protein [Nonomuraea sediminis]|uniref:ion channel protein n=1 Tax=Nonomuraea sediminis TaxID=2835864 RepID=UPI0027E0ADB9|nr:ion channel protein [Nonomuraea sediminis]
MISPPAKRLLPLVVPALVVGIAASLILMALTKVSTFIEHVVWQPTAWWWTIVVLTAAGVLTGLVLWKVPGHAGPDPATQSLVAPPDPMPMLPSVALAAIITLAGGVSLGPENPIVAINNGLAAGLGARLLPKLATPLWVSMAVSGTVGALFGTPVAAALMLSEVRTGDQDIPLWDRLFAPLVAAGAGSLTTKALAGEDLVIGLPAYPGFQVLDLVTGSAVAVVAVLLALAGVYAFPHLHRFFHAVPNPVLMAGLGGLVLGVLGVIGGPITLFKGLEQAKELAASSHSAGQLTLIVLVKLVALIVAATSGFRGGRIFPSVFLGVAFGLLAHALVPAIPSAVGATAGVLGFVLVITQQGWLSLFTAVAVVGQIELLPLAIIMILPAWLLVSGKPPMQVIEHAPAPGRGPPPPDHPPGQAGP